MKRCNYDVRLGLTDQFFLDYVDSTISEDLYHLILGNTSIRVLDRFNLKALVEGQLMESRYAQLGTPLRRLLMDSAIFGSYPQVRDAIDYQPTLEIDEGVSITTVGVVWDQVGNQIRLYLQGDM